MSTSPGENPNHTSTSTPPNTSSRGNSPARSAEIWRQFTAYSRTVRGENVTVFEDKTAKDAYRQQQADRLWIRSNEDNSAAFDVSRARCRPADFLAALASQYPAAVGFVTSRQAPNCVIVSFDSPEARQQACSLGIDVNSQLVLGTPTISDTSEVYRISLERLPLQRSDALSPRIREVMSQYGKVLHVGIFLDPQSKLFFGKGYDLVYQWGYEPLEQCIRSNCEQLPP